MNPTNNLLGPRTFGIIKLLPAPIHKVWEAWSLPDRVAQWWGPTGFTTTIHIMDFRANGEWKSTMHGPDGKNYPNKSRFLEIVPSRKIVFQHFNPDYLATVRFGAKGNETLMEWTNTFRTAELYETVIKVFKADKGLEQNVEKLALYLEQNKS